MISEWYRRNGSEIHAHKKEIAFNITKQKYEKSEPDLLCYTNHTELLELTLIRYCTIHDQTLCEYLYGCQHYLAFTEEAGVKRIL